MSGRGFCLCFSQSNSILFCTKLNFPQFEPIFLWWQFIFQCPFSSFFFSWSMMSLLSYFLLLCCWGGEVQEQLGGQPAKASPPLYCNHCGFKFEAELYSLLKAALWEPTFSGSLGIVRPRWLEPSLSGPAEGVCGASWLSRTFLSADSS